MLLPLIALFAHVTLMSSYKTEEFCAGSDYVVPIDYTSPHFTRSIYFKPKGKESIIAVTGGKSMVNRFSVQTGRIRLNGLTVQDDGAMIYFGHRDSVQLEVEDCQEVVSSYYGELFSWRIPSDTAYIEFSQLMSSGDTLVPRVIWNRTDPSAGTRGTLKRGYFELQNLKQKDNGYYKCRTSKGNILESKELEVKDYERYVDAIVGEDLEIRFSRKLSGLSQVLFSHRNKDYEWEIEIKYKPRMKLTERYFSIMDVQEEHDGVFKFIDNEGFLALRLEIFVTYQLPTWAYVIGVLVIVLFLVCCCCCVKKCCCKKSSNKRSSTETNAPQVFYHDSNQPTQPVVPLLSREPRVSHADPPTYNSSVGNMGLQPPTQITVSGRLERPATPVLPPSTDSDPRFELKGAVFPSAPPLSAGTDIQDVYMSDKLNFL